MDIDQLVEKAVQTIPQADETIRLGEGSDGVVYAVDENVVLKLYRAKEHWYRGSNKKNAEYEFQLGKELSQQGVQVPEYHGLFKPVKLPNLNHWGVFMENIHGVKYHSLPWLLKLEARQQYNKQKILISGLGYHLIDGDVDQNVMFDVKKKKLYLYDLVRWERK